MLDFGIFFVEMYFFLENYVTSEGAVYHNVFYYQQLSIACYQVSFYANNYFELLPIEFSTFKSQYATLFPSYKVFGFVNFSC